METYNPYCPFSLMLKVNILIINALFGILKNKSKVSKGNFNYDYLAKLNT